MVITKMKENYFTINEFSRIILALIISAAAIMESTQRNGPRKKNKAEKSTLLLQRDAPLMAKAKHPKIHSKMHTPFVDSPDKDTVTTIGSASPRKLKTLPPPILRACSKSITENPD
jgi:hypothetical protein